MLKSHPKGQTGNQLFQYTFTRLLAESTGYAAQLHSVDGFTLPTIIPGVITDLVECDGYYEQASIYVPHKEKIKEWILTYPFYIREQRTAIHIRGHDAAREGFRCPPIQYYRDAINYAEKWFPMKEKSIVTDDPDNDVCLSLAREFGIPVYCRSAIHDWEYIRNSAQIIIGNSTFSWWAAFLSGHNNVIQPEPLKGWRSREMPQKCLIVDEWKQIPY